MAKTFLAELKKAHRRHDLLLCLLFPFVVALWVGRVVPDSAEERAQGYSALFYSAPVLNSILFPVLMAVFASRLWDMEVKGGTPKLLYTLQSRGSLFIGKTVFGLMEVLLTVCLEMVMLLFMGKYQGITESLLAGQVLYLTFCTLAVCTMLFFSEFLLMLFFENPLPALCVGIAGALLGLFSAFMPPLFSYFVPWGYFIPLGTFEVANWDQATRTVTYGTRAYNWGLLAFTIVLGAGLFLASWCKVKKQEV